MNCLLESAFPVYFLKLCVCMKAALNVVVVGSNVAIYVRSTVIGAVWKIRHNMYKIIYNSVTLSVRSEIEL